MTVVTTCRVSQPEIFSVLPVSFRSTVHSYSTCSGGGSWPCSACCFFASSSAFFISSRIWAKVLTLYFFLSNWIV